MPVFDYRALQQDGEITEGQLDAKGRPEAFRQMEAKGLRPITLVERSGLNDNHQPKPTGRLGSGMQIDGDKTLGWGAAGLFALSLFLPAVNLDPWLPGFNLLVLSFLGTAVFLLSSFSSVFDGATNGDWSFGFCLLRFVVCLVGASANVLMITTFVRIVRGRRVPGQVAALSLALTLAAAGALCFLSKRSIDETLSYGYFAWAGCAGLLMVASLNQSPRMLPRRTKHIHSRSTLEREQP